MFTFVLILHYCAFITASKTVKFLSSKGKITSFFNMRKIKASKFGIFFKKNGNMEKQ